MIYFILFLLLLNIFIIDFVFYKLYKNFEKNINILDFDRDFWNEKED